MFLCACILGLKTANANLELVIQSKAKEVKTVNAGIHDVQNELAASGKELEAKEKVIKQLRDELNKLKQHLEETKHKVMEIIRNLGHFYDNYDNYGLWVL